MGTSEIAAVDGAEDLPVWIGCEELFWHCWEIHVPVRREHRVEAAHVEPVEEFDLAFGPGGAVDGVESLATFLFFEGVEEVVELVEVDGRAGLTTLFHIHGGVV